MAPTSDNERTIPLMALHLRARREALGLSQELAAERLGVDKDTVSRWERGQTKPKSHETLELLKVEFGVSQAELNDWYSDWAMRKLSNDDKYAIRGHDYLVANGMDVADLMQQIIDLDTLMIPGLASIDEGTIAQWAPIFEAIPLSWKLLTCAGKIVGYWHYVFLQQAVFEKVMQGRMRDSEIDLSMLEFPCFLSQEKTYRMYVVMVGVHSSHHYFGPGGKLINSFVREIERAAVNGLFVSEVVAVAHTPQGVNLCRNFGLDPIGDQVAPNRRSTSKIFYGRGAHLAKVGHISKTPTLARLYRERFR